MAMDRPYSVDDLRRFVALVWRPGDVYELRGLAKNDRGAPYVTTGYFDDPEAFVRSAAERSGKDTGVYWTLNPTNPALLARAEKNKLRRAGNGDTTSDRDVARRRSILIDIDPVRPAGISSTAAEHDESIAIAKKIATDLSAAGWPEPILADSGNGGHLIYSVDLPVDDGGLVKRVLERLSKTYTTPLYKVDEKVFNPARISKIYGTLTMKGVSTADRPHRLARILAAPDKLLEVTRDQLEALAPVQQPQQRPARGPQTPYAGPTFDLDAWISEHLPDAVAMSWSEGRKWLLPVCPFNSDHNRKEAFITQKDSGQIAAGCQHESCFRTWAELREKFEPGYAERRNGHANGSNGNGHRLTHREPPPNLDEDGEFFAEGSVVEQRDVVYEHPNLTTSERAEVDAIAARDAEPEAKPRTLWFTAPELVDAIAERANDPWISLTLGGDEIVKLRAGATAVLIGGSGSGKSSLALNWLVEHAVNVGPAIALSIELPAEELAARIVGAKNDASWEQALRGQVKREDMERALALPRLYVLDRRRATIANLEKCIDAARKRWVDQPILVAIDYAQLLNSDKREERQRVADVFDRIDDSAREKRYVAVALSQMSRAAARTARKGEALGAESSDLGAESAAIERFATVTIAIGMAAQREDGTSAVELSIGKARMGQGDRVLPATYEGRTGRWRLAGEAKTATEVRESRAAEKASKEATTLELAILGLVAAAGGPMSRADIKRGVSGKADRKVVAITRLLAKQGDQPPRLVEVMRKSKGARKEDWMIWTPDRAADAGIPIVPSQPTIGAP